MASTTTTTAALRGSIFVVEDDDELLQTLSAVLVNKGYGVQSVSSAREALSKLETGPPPDVILFDLMMPGMTGWEFRIEQRRRASVAAIPVVAMSADGSAKARAIDADAYLRKPFAPQELVDTIERVLVKAERLRLLAHSAEFERLRSLGLLSAGIAHEVNNPLAFVAGNTELARNVCAELEPLLASDEAAPLGRLKRHLSHVDQGLERIAAVVRSVATFSRPNESNGVPVDIREVLTATIRLVSNELRHRARLVLELDPVPAVLGNPAQVGQVFLNVLINALHAIPAGASSRHSVTVATRSSGDMVSVEVTDTGAGMSPELAARIFEPFFTTKPVDKGMGLGLSISRGIVSAMGGEISVRSEPGKGSSFRVDLPAHRGDFEARGSSGPTARSARSPPQVRHRVLVIDDEPMICDWLEAMLKDTCHVVVSTNSRAALQRIVAGEPFDVILCDLMMPELTGMDLFDEVRARRTEMLDRLVFMTGGAFTDQASAFLDRMRLKTLRKPFRLHELFAMIEAQCARSVSKPSPRER